MKEREAKVMVPRRLLHQKETEQVRRATLEPQTKLYVLETLCGDLSI